jgi:crotonobetainyl-CoA:carnitine CoA-transferase CaiB-like acyl-CoA transferase
VSNPHPDRPLDGVFVLDLSRVLAGPYCTQNLADMGARIVKVEHPERGDDTRGYGPPFKGGESCYFMAINRGKESVAVDLKHPEGLALVRRLAERADVVVENFRPGAAERLGLSYAQLAERNPGLVYVSISGFGHAGDPEYVARPGYDLLAQGLSGVQALTGDPDGPPTRVGVAVGDLVSGLYGVMGVLAALRVRERTGRGQHVDVSLLDTLTSLLSYQAGIALNGDGEPPRRLGSAHPTICPYDTFAAADGFVNIAAGNDALFARLARALGRPDWLADERFAQNAARVAHREALYAELRPLVAARSVADWDALLRDEGIPGGPILEIEQTLAHPQLAARGMVASLEHPRAGRIRVTGFPFGLSDTPCGPTGPPPLLGEHTDAVLAELLGADEATLERLRESGAIG